MTSYNVGIYKDTYYLHISLFTDLFVFLFFIRRNTLRLILLKPSFENISNEMFMNVFTRECEIASNYRCCRINARII